MYHKATPKFLFYIIIIFVVAIVGIVTWSAFITKPYIVKAQSILTVENKSVITVAANANIKSISIKEGDLVKLGDILLVQDTLEIDLQIAQINTTIAHYGNRILLYDRLIDYISNDYDKDEPQHCFDKTNIEELEFYNYMSAYALEKASYVGQEILLANLKLQKLDTYLSQRNSHKTEYNKVITQKKAYEDSKNIYIIKANSSGIIHLNGALNQGMFLQAGSNIGSILSDKDALFAECYLNAIDRPKVNIGDKVKLAIQGLSQNEYGVLKGELVFIDSNATATENNYFFKAKVLLDKSSISSDKNTIILLNGMQAESRIVYEETTYLKYFLEQIGIKIK